MDPSAFSRPHKGRFPDSSDCLISVINGPSFKGTASNLSVNGLYIDVVGDQLPGRNAEVEIFLRESQNTPDLCLRGTVARRSNAEDRTDEGHVGVGIRILEAPTEYHALFADGAGEGSSRRPHTPYPLLAYDGNTLDDVLELLKEMGAQPRRVRVTGPEGLKDWDDVPKLLLVDAADALTLDVPHQADHQGVLRVAIASSQSEILGSLLRRLGYQYLIRRPLHRDAIEILLRNLLHKGQSRRESSRVVMGVNAKISIRAWTPSRQCSLLDLSRGGCLLASRSRLPLRRKVRLIIGSEVTGDQPMALTGRVIRRRFDDASKEWQVALRFHPSLEVQGAKIGRLLQRTTVGPINKLKPSLGHRALASFSHVLGLGRKLLPLPAHPDRRRDPRARYDRHVCKLDSTGTRVTALLAGYDLTHRGMRVHPHPELELGTQFAVSLHDQARQRPIEVSAEVIRDDGSDGFALRFVDLDSDLARRIDSLVAALPSAKSLIMAGIESSIENVARR
jgi:hypothetical protein